MLAGLDLSSVQGVLTAAQWDLIASRGTRFVITKVGNGNNHCDPDGMADILMAERAGIGACGVYHFPFPLPTDPAHPGRAPEDQAQMHFQQCQGYGSDAGHLPATIDLEYPRPEQWGKPLPGVDNSVVTKSFLQDWFGRYRAVYERLQGCKLIVYGDPWFLQNLELDSSWAANPLWEAAYGATVPAVKPWAGWTLRQLSGGGGVLPNGCPVDTDCIVDEATLQSLLKR